MKGPLRRFIELRLTPSPGGLLRKRLPLVAVASVDSGPVQPMRQKRRRNNASLSDRCLAARELALSLMAQHGLPMWDFGFNTSKRQLGRCIFRAKRIELSVYLCELNPEEEVRQTVLHELVHALLNEPGHGAAFRAKCLELG